MEDKAEKILHWRTVEKKSKQTQLQLVHSGVCYRDQTSDPRGERKELRQKLEIQYFDAISRCSVHIFNIRLRQKYGDLHESQANLIHSKFQVSQGQRVFMSQFFFNEIVAEVSLLLVKETNIQAFKGPNRHNQKISLHDKL